MNIFHAKLAYKVLFYAPPVATAILALDQSTINSVALLGVAIIGLWNAQAATRAATKLTLVEKTTKATHILSNSAMGAQLQTAVADAQEKSILFHRIAEMGGNMPNDIAAAAAADVKVAARQALYQAHLVQQAKVDSDALRDG